MSQPLEQSHYSYPLDVLQRHVARIDEEIAERGQSWSQHVHEIVTGLRQTDMLSWMQGQTGVASVLESKAFALSFTAGEGAILGWTQAAKMDAAQHFLDLQGLGNDVELNLALGQNVAQEQGGANNG